MSSRRRPRRSGPDRSDASTERLEARRVARNATIDALESAGRISFPDDLPISASSDELIEAIRDHQVVVVAGETGSGKSTQLPKLALAAGRGRDGMIGHTQPRRVAARAVAERVAAELHTELGGAVGYTVRFNDSVGDGTAVRVMTDGILLAELQHDRELARYDTLIIDEAHERSLNIDFILGYVKRLLARRPDLHVVITSATIDTERFAEHFSRPDGSPAPVFVVEGRTYPVEVRYRPYGADNPDDEHDRRDQVRAVVDAIDELEAEGPGDVLVFLSGEREIHDIADALRTERRTDVDRGRLEVLPLYARLSAAEQHRIFESHRGRRIVLSTNVAETSITVPGIRYVVDAGTARISRYSKRLKVQRLPIEPVSQASANQRAGRCGRVAPGICVRLYTEDDYGDRPEFTEPEILRTNLAAVILQMTALGLGDVDRFPFVEPPESSSVRDGVVLLDELGALSPDDGGTRRLTKIGRQLARLPIDPRLGRMVIEAERVGAVREVLVIASALSMQDVRERPKEQPERAAELHRRFAVDGSDLLSIVELWDYLRERQRELSGNQFRRMCRDEHLHYLRVREWRDLYSQLRQVAGQLGIRPSVDEAHPDHVHRAVLAGLLSQIGLRDGDRRDYIGARNARFNIAPGSVLTKRSPRWVMAAELVETNQIWARRVAAIQPEWAESLAGHLVKRAYGEAHWEAEQGRAVTSETVTLYGLPIVSNRTIGVDRVDPDLAREMFIRHALVAGDAPVPWLERHAFVGANELFRSRVRLLEARVRRTDLLDDETLTGFFDERLPAGVTSTRAFDRWWRDAREREPALLDLTPSVLTGRSGIDLADYPDAWHDASGEYRLTYRFEPGTALDGATLNLPVTALNQLDTDGFDWLVPGYRRELVTMLLRSLPKDVRRHLIPMAETADAAFERLGEPSGRLVDRLATALTEVTGHPVNADDFDVRRIPGHLRLHIVVVDEHGQVLDAGDDLDAIRRRQAGTARSAIAAAAPIEERRDITSWDLGTLDRVVEQRAGDGHLVRAYPTLLDRGDRVSLRVVDNPGLQERAMRGGVRRLLLMAAAPTPAKVRRSLDQSALLALAAGEIDVDDLVDDSIQAAVDAVMARSDLPWDDRAFSALEAEVRSDAGQLAADALAEAADIAAAADRVERRLGALTATGWQPTVADVRAHVARLVGPGFVRRSGTDRLPDVHRYLRGVEHRLDHLAGDVARDERRMGEVLPVEREVALATEGRTDDAVRELAWMIEELRMSVFAQSEGVKGPVSAKRIRRALREATG